MRIFSLAKLSIALILIMIVPSQVVQASETPKIIVSYVAEYNRAGDDSYYKIRPDEEITNPNINSAGYFKPDAPDFYGYYPMTQVRLNLSKNASGTYYTEVLYGRIAGNDNVLLQGKDKFFKKDEVKDIGYWEQKDGNWYFVQERYKLYQSWSPVAGAWEGPHYRGYTINGVYTSPENGDFEKHYKMGPVWIKPDAFWYHLDSKGKMETGWIHDNDGNWYYCWSNGQMATDTDVYGHYVDANGVMIS